MRIPRSCLPGIGLVLLISCLPIEAQYAADQPSPPVQNGDQDGLDRVERKEPSIFRRPDRDTPAEQLAFARALEQDGKGRTAAKAYRALVHKWHDAPEAPAAQRAYAEWLYQRGDYREAFQEFQYLIEFYADRIPYDKILQYQLKIANQISGVPFGDVLFLPGFSASEKAIPYFKQIVKNAPNWGRAPEAQFHVGLIYEETGSLDEAIGAYERLQSRYPGSEYTASASFRKATCLVTLADKNPRDEQTCRQALSALSAFLRDYHGDPNVGVARDDINRLKERLAEMYYERAVFYDRLAKRPKAAMIAYADFIKKFPDSARAELAASRLTELRDQGEDRP
jgi:outer membrane protein assembly factor BamD (BamD/ComL family)